MFPQVLEIYPARDTHLFRPLLPSASMPSLLPFADHLGHVLHSLSPFLQFASELSLPQLSLHFLANSRALHPQPILYPLLLLDLRVFERDGHQRKHVVL